MMPLIVLSIRRTRDMSWRTIATSVATVVAAGLLHVAPAHAGDVSVGVSIGVPVPRPAPVIVAPPQVVVPAPPPPVVSAAPPRVILVPGSPVYYAPGVDFNLFVYSGRYYRFHEGAWFIAASHRGPWTYVVRERVPQHVLAVPVTYYRMPPGHAKKMEGRRFEDHGKGKHGKHD
jgi:hypothetical protein